MRAPRPSWTVLPAESSATTVLDHLIERFPKVDRTTWIDRMQRRLVRAEDGTVIDPETPFRPHWRVSYFREVTEQPRIPFASPIVYHDPRIVVVDKAPFLPVTPGGRFVTECLLYRVQAQLGDHELAPAHRLDRHTSGLVLLVRRAADRGRYARCFANGTVDRRYAALCHLDRWPPQRRWRVVDRLGLGEPFFRQRRVAGRANSETEVRLRAIDGAFGEFRLRPMTGKQHQLRLHLCALGFPIVGDPFYPKLRPEAPDRWHQPLRLIARELRLVDPFTGRDLRFVSRRSLEQPTHLSPIGQE